jgi:hypothetical protein
MLPPEDRRTSDQVMNRGRPLARLQSEATSAPAEATSAPAEATSAPDLGAGDCTVASLLARLRGVPRRESDYSVDEFVAREQYGCDEATLSALRGEGLASDDGRHFADWDLHFLGLRLGIAERYLWAAGSWRRSLERFTSKPATRVQIAYLPQLGKTQPQSQGHIMLSDERVRQVKLHENQVAGELEVTMCAHWPEMPADIATMLEDIATIEFCLLPQRLRGNCALARRLNLADCSTAARMIVEECRQSGHEARVAHGLMVALPFSSTHTWAEVRVESIWTAVDPLMIIVLRRFAGLDPDSWPACRPLGALLARLQTGCHPTPIVTAAGKHVPTTFLTRLA